MCGIVGFCGKENCAGLLIEGLKKLEYRGYDSAGIALEVKNKITVLKAVGQVKNLEDLVKKSGKNSHLGIAHTRWATHGKPSLVNSHPHTDCTGNIALVHNGIIENYLELKNILLKKGHKFKSETDTEVIAHLLEEELNCEKDFFTAFQKTTRKLKGAFALVALNAKFPGVMVAAKRQSPLVAGISKKGFFLASDIPAFLNHTNKAIFFEDGDTVKITPDSIEIYDGDFRKTTRKIHTISWDISAAEKGGFEHFMLKEIHDEPQNVKDTLQTLPADITKAFGLPLKEAKKFEGLYIVACGTAYHAALVARYTIEHFAKIPVEVEMASEFKYRPIHFKKNWLFVAVSQSGETADTLAALKNAKAHGLKVLSVCNVVGSAIVRESDYSVFTHCGPEISVASTKAFTCQLTVLYALALQLAYVQNSITKAEFEDLYQELLTLPELLKQTLKLENDVKKIAAKVYKSPSFIFIARNASFPLALEGALKLKEISYKHAEGFAAGEIKHGPIAIIEKNIPVVALAPKSSLYEKMLSSCQEVSARGARVIVVTNTTSKNALEVPYTNEYLFPLLAATILQFYAYFIAKFLGREIDKPRNLAKSVTVE
ncbi:MAG: glutamine--fructose-6-phosphate transaminase (isomerizing) [Elusimicrobiaceae bacterium]|nr:glutamine--fructose-6-phosphate transaminase (isomerizing) [Elusimicrobiaceae bacterium]